MARGSLEQRVERVAEEALAEQQHVSLVDVLVRLRWLHPSHVDLWRQGRLDSLEDMIQVNPEKLLAAISEFGHWAQQRGLVASEMDYVARTPDRRPLRFSLVGVPEIERAYRTEWLSPDLPDTRRERILQREAQPPDLVVISPLKEWTCGRCGGTGDFLIMQDDTPLCLRCARLDHLVFLPSGDAGLTRRARKASATSAVVVRFSRSRKRYERQGLLVEPAALAEPHRR